MHINTRALLLSLFVLTTASLASPAVAQTRRLATIERATRAVDADGRLRADVLGRTRRTAVPRDLPLRPGTALSDVAAGGSRLQPDRSRPGADGRDGRGDVPARRPEGPAHAGQLPLPRLEPGRRRAPGGGRLVRALGAVGLQGRSRPRTGACSSTRPTSCCATRTASASACARANQGAYRVDANRTTFHLPRTKAFPKNSEVETIVTFVTDGAPGDAREPGGADGDGAARCGSITRSCSCRTWRRIRTSRASPIRAPAAST